MATCRALKPWVTLAAAQPHATIGSIRKQTAEGSEKNTTSSLRGCAEPNSRPPYCCKTSNPYLWGPRAGFQHPIPAVPEVLQGKRNCPTSKYSGQTPPSPHRHPIRAHSLLCPWLFGAPLLVMLCSEGGEQQESCLEQSTLPETDRQTRKREETPTLLLYLGEG